MIITDFLTMLGQEPAKLEAFQQNPLQFMQDAGLTADDRLALGFRGDTKQFTQYEDGMFYTDFNGGSVICQLFTKSPILSNKLPNLQVGWKISENGELQMNQPMPTNGAGQIIIEGGQEVDLPTDDGSQRNRVWIVDKISGKCYPADILHLKVLVHTDQDCC